MDAAPRLRALDRIFAGWQFPAAVLSVLVFYKLLLLAVLMLPVSPTAVGQFAEEFKTWCFGYDPATGKMQPMYVAMMLTEPVIIGGLIALVWWKQLVEVWRAAPRRLVPYPAVAAALVAVAAAGMYSMRSGTAPTGELPFPAERLRTHFAAPQLALVDQDGKTTTLEEHRGKVVILTGVYATCGYTCPMILQQAKRAVKALSPEQRARVSVLALTLDPKRDTPEAMTQMARGQGVSAPTFRLLTGDPTKVEALLDRLGIERRRNPETGAIDHTNLFLVVDREGRIAYRFTLGERQENWLVKSLEFLLAETPVG